MQAILSGNLRCPLVGELTLFEESHLSYVLPYEGIFHLPFGGESVFGEGPSF